MIVISWLFFVKFLSINLICTEASQVCNSTTSESVQYEYTADLIPGQHIVTFKGYFVARTRENYLNAALKNAGVRIWVQNTLWFELGILIISSNNLISI